VVKTNSTGGVTWSKTYGGSNWEQAWEIKQTADAGYFIGAYSITYGQGGREPWLLKTNSSGASGCNEGNPATLTTVYTATTSSGGLAGTGGTDATPATAVRRSNAVIATQCFSGGGCPVAASFTASATTVCTGTTVTFSNTSTGATAYTWKENGVTFSTAANPSLNFPTAGSFSISLIAGNGSCNDTTAMTITVNPTPTASISPGGPAGICPGSSALLTGGGGPSWQWHHNGTVIGGATSSTYSASQTGAYTLVVTNSFGCKDSTGNAFNLTIFPAPSVNLGPDQSACMGSTVVLDAGPGFSSYSWTGGSASQGLAVTTSGAYSVTVTDANGCQATDTINVTFVAPPVAAFSSSANFLAVSFSDNSTGNPTSWSWDFGDGNSSSVQSPSHTYAQSGNYLVCLLVSSSMGCRDSVCRQISVFETGLHANLLGGCHIVPNPAQSYFDILLPDGIGACTIVVFDLSGRRQRGLQGAGGSRIRVEREGLFAGLYFVKVETEEGQAVFKLILD
jgi:PKD repeat protein